MIPFVSIVISAYNEQRHIKRAILSALRQTLQNIEVIVVNDASTDHTADIVSDLASNDQRLRLISHTQNMGLSQTRLTGLDHARGEYVQFLDADDYLLKEATERLYYKASASNCDIISMGIRHNHNRLRLKLTLFSPIKFFKKDSYHTSELMTVLLGKRGLTLSLCDKLYKRDLLQSLDLKAEQFMGEDMLTNMRIFNSDATLSWIDYIGYNYTSGGASRKSSIDLWNANKKLYSRCVEVLREINADNATNRQALAEGLAETFIASIASQIANPLHRNKSLGTWIQKELASEIWSKTIPFLSPRYTSIINCDTDATIAVARKYFKAHKLSYLLTLIFD